MIRKSTYKKFIIALLTVLFLVLALTGGQKFLPALAALSDYTTALDDLRKDSNFNSSIYPDNASDYSISVIQVAESSNGELFIYTYQPCQKTQYLVATDINMSLTESVSGTKLYELTLINTSGVLGKYKVNGLTVSKEAIRHYNITSIYREWLNGKDKESGNDNIINGVAFEVAQLWEVRTVNGTVSYQMQATEVVTVTDKYVGRVRYPDGFYLFGTEKCDGWFVAFSSDYDIEKLYEADVEWQERYFNYKGVIEAVTNKYITTSDKSDKEPHREKKTLYYDEKVSNSGSGLFGKKYTWKRIESASEFVKKEELTDDAKKQLSNKQWILRFTETDFTSSRVLPVLLTPGSFQSEYSEVSEVTILRLKFETDGKVYNLGVVDNKQTGTTIVNKPEDQSFWQYVWNCIKKLFTGKASTAEAIVAITVIVVTAVVAVIVIKYLIRFLKWLFGSGNDEDPYEEPEEEPVKRRGNKKGGKSK